MDRAVSERLPSWLLSLNSYSIGIRIEQIKEEITKSIARLNPYSNGIRIEPYLIDDAIELVEMS